MEASVARAGDLDYNMPVMAIDEQIKQTIGKALGRIPSGVFILTARHQEESAAMMASWVQQAAFEPPAVSVALAKGRVIVPMIRASNRAALSIVSAEDTSLMKRYARGVEPGKDPFDGVAIINTPSGVPVLADALGWLECEVISVCEFGADHDLLIAQITAGKMLREGQAFTHQRGNGFHY
jgi:3-hydroxy-9,10-secoandrosta-1,3,5(10)-triene-9,17-dione monooxygenase reductase component